MGSMTPIRRGMRGPAVVAEGHGSSEPSAPGVQDLARFGSGEPLDLGADDFPVPATLVRYTADMVVPCDGTGMVLAPGVLEVEGGRLVHVGRTPTNRVATEVRLEGAVLPGLVNVHAHSPMVLFRGSGEGLPLDRWLTEVLWPREAKLTAEDVYWGMVLGAAESLRFGVTTTCEMYFEEDAIADAVLATGGRAVITPAILQFPDDDGNPSWAGRLEEVAEFHRRRNGDGGRIEVGFGPHAPYSVPPEVLTVIGALAAELGSLVHLHVAETKAEVDQFIGTHGRRIVHALADVGLLEGRLLAAHAVWIDDEEISLLAEAGASVAHCPQSNAKLASGIAPLTGMLTAGVRVGLGTDGPASNNDLDLWKEMRLAASLARLRERDAGVVSAVAALDMATRAAGHALGRPDLGSLYNGAAADFILVDLDDAVFSPMSEPTDVVGHLVWSAQSRLVTDVWVGGRKVVAGGRCLTVDVDEARTQVTRRATRLVAD